MIEKYKVDISWTSLYRVVIVGFLIFCAFYFSQLLLWIFLALIISFLFNPVIDLVEKYKIVKPFSTILVYGIFIALVVVLFWAILPDAISEIAALGNNLSFYANNIITFLQENGFTNIENVKTIVSSSQEQILNLISNTINVAKDFLSGFFAVLTIFSLAIFLSIERDFPVKIIKMLTFKKETEKAVINSFEESRRQVVGYFNAKIVASTFVAISTALFCYLFGIKYAIILGILSGILNIIPIIGPVISCLLLAFFAVFNSWTVVVIVIVFSIVLQQIESNVLVPILTKKIIGIPTTLVLIAVLIGARVGGVLGAIFIIPVVGIIYTFISNYSEKRKASEK
jgi:predicted PurR-regulated permease PerM